jgi:SAM-dependent methyltransferase
VFGIFNKSHRATLDRILSAPSAAHTPRSLFGEVDDDFWLWCFTKGYRTDERLRAVLPGFPPEDVQYQFAGAAGDATMKDAFGVYTLVRSLARQHLQGPLDSVLEFGCGWGRIVRLFTKDVEPDRLWGNDCLPVAIEICTATNRHAQFRQVDPFPPTTLPDNSFDLVYAYSVFSHLSEAAHLAWLGEFKRILRPRGLLVATTRPREFIRTCARARASGDQQAWSAGTRLAFLDTTDALARYDRGEYLFEGLGAGDVLAASFFGETCIPLQYVLDHWTRSFEFVGYVDDRRLCLQNAIVVRKA